MSDFILVVIVIIIVFSVFRRYIFFFLMKALSERLFNKMKQQENPMNKKPEGSITIDTTNAKGKKRNDDDGEFVPYEEIK
ncbi:MAG: hypothetical protein ABI772_12095 [Bacteroidota bacterium]